MSQLNPETRRSKTSTVKWTKARLEKLIEQACVDAYGEDEQLVGFEVHLQDSLQVPFETKVLGETVTVESVGLNDTSDMVATCRRGEHTLNVALADLPLPRPAPKGAEWIAAFRLWREGW